MFDYYHFPDLKKNHYIILISDCFQNMIILIKKMSEKYL